MSQQHDYNSFTMARFGRLSLQAILAVLIALASSACSRAPGNTTSAVVHDTHGVPCDPLHTSGAEAVVLFFIAHQCPISNEMAPQINRIVADYAPRKVSFYIVYAEKNLSDGDARAHAKAFGYTFPALLDPAMTLVRQTGATVTPEAIVISPNGNVLYHGRINNLYESVGVKRSTITREDLRLALDDILASRPVATPQTQAVGCTIESSP